MPLNSFGRSLGTGRIHVLWHIIEGALQASGRAGPRQVKDANVSFVGASAPIVAGTTFIFFGDPYSGSRAAAGAPVPHPGANGSLNVRPVLVESECDAGGFRSTLSVAAPFVWRCLTRLRAATKLG